MIIGANRAMRYFVENFCDECDAVLNAVFDYDRFWSFEVGRVKCTECGHVNVPCNECFGTDIMNIYGCLNCPWVKSVVSISTEESKSSMQREFKASGMPVPYRLREYEQD